MRHLKKAVPLLAIAAIVGLSACGGGDDSTASTEAAGGSGNQTTAAQKPATPTIVVKGDEPVGGVQELEYSAGEQIRFDVRSDSAGEVHVHGYDIEKGLPANGVVHFSFPAELEGIYDVELHPSEHQIAELRVNP